MKLLIFLIFLIFSKSLVLSKRSIADDDDSTLLFANFFSYSDSDCNESNGFGYSLKVDQCLGAFAPYQQNPDYFWKIEFDKGSNSIITTRYSEWDFNCDNSGSYGGSSGTSGGSTGSGNQEHQYIIKNNECTTMPNFTVIPTSSLSGMGSTWYTRASISIGKPQYASSTTTVREYYNDNSRGNCDMTNFDFAVTYTQDLTLKVEEVNQSETWFCKDNHPLENSCDYNGKNCEIFDNTMNCDPSSQTGNQHWYCINV